ncbi:MAG: nuclear transport factor 2 family protein [Gammaproteobacteria bacterium]|jgi:hypothetical protein|nr:MAG: nuclear transport factor 2 family protein [Gammaproteobacteria bacterium]
MKKIITTTRRQLLAGATGITAATLLPTVQAQCNEGISRAQYDQYLDWFNNNDPRFADFYHEDVELELRNATIKGRQGILDFYAEVKQYIKETVIVDHFVSDATGIAAVVPSEFRCFKDWDSQYFGRQLKKGEVFRIISFGIYWVVDGKFKQIKAARYKLVNEWQMEG